MLLTTSRPTVEEFRQVTGWKLEPRGACRAEMCVPLPAGAVVDERVQLDVVSGVLGMGVVADPAVGLWAVGPETLGGQALSSVEAPALELPDFDGRPFRLDSLRGSKVVLVAWAPY